LTNARNDLACMLLADGRVDEPEAIFEECRETNERLGRRFAATVNLINLAGCRMHRADVPAARALYDEVLATHRDAVPGELAVVALDGLGSVAALGGVPEPAAPPWRSSEASLASLGGGARHIARRRAGRRDRIRVRGPP
jgi:hypothetical protein